ncbi:MAG: DMT family transporter [Gemmatimonadaceae bacterium]|nr:DMT family transporter [Gemmatimonadaceae bacterium]
MSSVSSVSPAAPVLSPAERPAALADWSLIAVPGVIWGASFLFIAEGLKAVAPMGVTVLRIAIGFVVLAVFPAAWKGIERKDWSKIAWLGLLWMAFPLSMFPFAEQRISSAIAGMLNGSVPLTTAIIASIIARRLPARGVIAGLGVGLVGVVMMAVPDLGSASRAAGIAMVTIACVSYGFAPNIARPLQHKYGALPVIWRAQMVALALTLPLGFRDVLQAQWSLGPVLALLGLGALGTGAAHVVMTVASGRLGATKASAAAFLIPPVALLLGVLVRGERVAVIAVAGGALCVAGAWLMRRSNVAR